VRKEIFSSKIIDWYEANHRNLPWRQTADPYKIWLSEIILQQTRVAQGLPYYELFIESFPTVFELAKASEQKVLRIWQGLGYYARARNLHCCARLIVGKYNGNFPNKYEDLIKLPGIGDYTAAAIASIAFREPVAVVDGNVFRVLARVFGIAKDTGSVEGRKYFFELANELIDREKPDQFNQAQMEFGALQCMPKLPKCGSCIFANSCEANRKDLQAVLPVKLRKQKPKTRHFYYFVIKNKKGILMKQRIAKDIWMGLNDFYLIETSGRQKPESLLKKDGILKKAVVINKSKVYKHILSHQKLLVSFIGVKVALSKQSESIVRELGMKWHTKKQIEKIPKPILIERFLNDAAHDKDFW
jgi:A/G-specific adenine glycosylase